MSQTTNEQNENEYTWARRPGTSSESPDAAPVQAPIAGTTSEFAPPGGSVWGADEARTDNTAPTQAAPVQAPPNQAPPAAEAGTAPYPAAAPYGDTEPGTSYQPTAAGAGYPAAAPASYQAAEGDAPSQPAPSQPAQYQAAPYQAAPYQAAPYQAPYEAPGGTAYQTPDSAFGGLPPEPPNGGTEARREPRRPGWGGVLAIGFGAAALSSLLTAGIVLQTQDNTTPTTISTAGLAPTVKAPVTGSNASAPDWSAVAKAVEPSVVSVKVTGQSAAGEGSGVILDKTGRIVTNNHVVSGVGSNPTVTVVLNDGDTYPATVVGTDSATDLAVIKLTNPPANLTPAVFGTSTSVGVGDPVMAVGNPLGLAGTVTTGIVSATDRPTTTQAESTDPNDPSAATGGGGEVVVTNAIQTDAAVNPGNSGGALVDAQGRVIGIPSSIASLSDGSSLGGQATQSGNIGLGFAIPVDEVQDVTSQLIKGGSVQHSWLGVTPEDGTTKVNGATRDAAILHDIAAGSPAAKAGLKTGDAVVAVDGKQVNSALSLVGQLRERRPNTTVSLTIVRAGQPSDIKVTLGDRPANLN
jgi:putative serine protease PepD